MSLLQTATPEQTTALRAPPPEMTNEQALMSLTSYVLSCFYEAKSAKEASIVNRLLANDRQRAGEYDPERKAAIAAMGGSDVFMMLTDIKSRAAQAWINDVLLNAKSFGFDPTPEPDLPPSVKEEVVQAVMAEAQEVLNAGMQIHPAAIRERVRELAVQVTEEVKEEARRAALAMETRVNDILKESKFEEVLVDVVGDFVTYPACFFRGPVVRKRKTLKWGPDWTPIVTVENAREFYRINPYDAFPSPGATSVQDGYFVERVRLNRGNLLAMIGVPGYNEGAIREVLRDYGEKGYKMQLMGDTEKDLIDGKHLTHYSRNQIEGLRFDGPVQGKLLIEWGMENVDPELDYEAEVWVVGRHTIRAVLNADPLGRRSLSSASFIRVAGSIWGRSLPESMADVQVMCNGSARSLANNMGMASGPMAEVQVDRLAEGEKVTAMRPWRIFQTTSDLTGGGQPAIRFFQPGMNAEPLLGVLAHFSRMADEVTGVPNYIYGSTAVGGAGRTSSGLAMLMENAAKGIKDAILSLDRAVTEMLTRLFEHLMLYDPDPSIKGDIKLVPRGVVATLIKDAIEERRIQFTAQTANAIDFGIMGPRGRAALLRKQAEALEMDTDDVIPTDAEIEAQMQMQAQMQAMQMQAQAQGQPQGGAAPALQ